MSKSHRSNTLDRLQRFSFGGSRSSSKDRKKESLDERKTDAQQRKVNSLRVGNSNSEKTERLRELTEKLKGLSPQVRCSPTLKRPNRRLPPSVKNITNSGKSFQTPNTENPAPAADTSEEKKVATDRNENGSSSYRKIPHKSVSFSQVDFSSIDGKYVRRKSVSNSSSDVGERTPVVNKLELDTSVDNRSLTHPLDRRAQIHSRGLIRSVPSQPFFSVPPPTSSPPEQTSSASTIDIPSVVAEINNDKSINTCDTSSNNLSKNCDITSNQHSLDNFSNLEQLPRPRNSSSSVDKSRKRKGIYITKWPSNIDTTKEILGGDTCDTIPTIYLQDGGASDNETGWQDDCTPEDWYGDPCNGLDWPQTDKQLKLSNNLLVRVDSLSESESEHRDYLTSSRPSIYSDKSDFSDCEVQLSNSPRRYSKRPLRGPYGQMLEAEMKKPADTNKTFSKLYYNKELKFLDDLMENINNDNSLVKNSEMQTANSVSNVIRTRSAGNRSLDETHMMKSSKEELQPPLKNSPQRKTGATALHLPVTAHNSPLVRHQRTTSSPSKLEGIVIPTKETQSDSNLRPNDISLKASTECLTAQTFLENLSNPNDTRTHIVVELYDTEQSYVESLQILVTKYLQPLKKPENAVLLDRGVVDEIFYQVPQLLEHHEVFLEELHKRLDHWDVKQKIGDIFIDVFTKPSVIETYTAFVNNWKKAKEIIKTTKQAKPAFARFLENMAKEHKGKLQLDSLLIKPIQKFPKYEMLIQRLLKHTDVSHPDYPLLVDAQHQIHELLLKINCTEFEQQQQNLKELECLVEGLMNLVVSDRQYLRHDLVTMVTTQGTRKDRALFLFSDLLVITSIKRRSGTVRKPSTICPASVANSLETHKYKLLMRLPLDDLEIIKPKDDNMRRMLNEIENISEDLQTLNQINELVWSLHCTHEQLDEILRDMISTTSRQLAERQNSGSQLSCLELSLNTSSGIEVISILFPKNEIRASWEDAFTEAKQKLALSPNRRPLPEFMSAVPIRKTRSGLQFTCAAPTLVTTNITGTLGAPTTQPPLCQTVWVCNSDGYVGQVCVLSLYPEPTVVSCNGVCNARILCMASIPAQNDLNIDSSGKGGSTNVYKNNMTYTNCKTGYSTRSDTVQTCTINSNIHFDSSSSSDSDNEDVELEEQTRATSATLSDVGGGSDSNSVDFGDVAQPTMWLGTEDGCIHMYSSSDNIRIKKNKIKIQHSSAVQCIIYLDNRVFVALANGDITIYTRDNMGIWNTTDPSVMSIGTASMPVIRMIPYNGKLWCGCPNSIKILNTTTLQVDHTFSVSNESGKQLSCMTISGLGVWVSIHNSAVIKCFHANTYEMLCEVNVTPTVNKMLSSCDDIIRQHKAACLRVTALLACKDLLWVGTSAGVLLTVLIPHVTQTTERITSQLTVTGLSHGHTGQVRFLTFVEDTVHLMNKKMPKYSKYTSQSGNEQNKILIISGGDGYEDFRNASVSEMAGREDSTNHLLLWHV